MIVMVTHLIVMETAEVPISLTNVKSATDPELDTTSVTVTVKVTQKMNAVNAMAQE